MGEALATADGVAGDGADDGLGLDAGVVASAAKADGATTVGVALGTDDAVAQAEPSKAMATNQGRMGTSIPIPNLSCACSVAHNAYGPARS